MADHIFFTLSLSLRLSSFWPSVVFVPLWNIQSCPLLALCFWLDHGGRRGMGTEEGQQATLGTNLRPVTSLVQPPDSPSSPSLTRPTLYAFDGRRMAVLSPSSASHHELVAAVQNQLLWRRAEVRLPPVTSRRLSWWAATQPEPVAGLTGFLPRLRLCHRGPQATGGEQRTGGGGAEAVVRGRRARGVRGEGGWGIVGGDGGGGVCGVLGVGLAAQSSSALSVRLSGAINAAAICGRESSNDRETFKGENIQKMLLLSTNEMKKNKNNNVFVYLQTKALLSPPIHSFCNVNL